MDRLTQIRETFTRRTIVLLVIALVLLVVGSSIAVAGFNAPKTKEREVTHLSYQITGGFDHETYGQSTKGKTEPNPIYFSKIIESIEVSYSYKFLSEETVSRVTEQVEISAVVTSPGMWEKEITLVPLTEKTGDFSISFPLNPSDFLELADNVSEEIGITRTSPNVILKTTVHTVAETQSGVLKDDFIQTAEIRLTPTIIEWKRPFNLSRKGYWEGVIYEHQGNFSYAIQLKPNILFGTTAINSDIPVAEPLEKVAHSLFYPSDTTETIEVTFSYLLDSNPSLSQVENEVEVSAVLSKPGGEEILFELVPKSQWAGDFTITFPLDVALFYNIIEATEEEGSTTDYKLLVKADVHTVARSEFGVIDEVLSPNLAITLEPDQLVWPEETEETKSGSITETVVTSNPGRRTATIGSLGVFGMMAAILLYAIWSYREAKRMRVPTLEGEAFRARKMYKDIIVDVQDIASAKAGEVIIPIENLDELVKVAEALLKPVLHKAEVEEHTYYVIDGSVRYQCVSDYAALGQKKTFEQRFEERIIREIEKRQEGKEDSNN